MKLNFVALFFTFLSFVSWSQTDIELEYPEVILSNVETKVRVIKSDQKLPAQIICNGKTVDVITNEEGQSFMIEFNDKDLIIEGFQHNQPTSSVIPLWMSILPPIIAIILALVFKEVIFSLFSGLFLGGAIMGVYAKGFIGIFTGFFSVIDTYIINSLNDSGHLSVVVFSILMTLIFNYLKKNYPLLM